MVLFEFGPVELPGNPFHDYSQIMRIGVAQILQILVVCGVAIYTTQTYLLTDRPPIPEVCASGLVDETLEKKLVAMAFNEALRNGVDVNFFKKSFAVHNKSRSKPHRDILAVRFSPFPCRELVLDGGGFDVEFDPETLKIVDSYMSTR